MSHKGHAEVTIKDSCSFGGNKGFVLHCQHFPNNTQTLWYWVLLPNVHPTVGFWYAESSLDVTAGKLPIPDKSTIKKCKIEKDSNIAYFAIDRATIDMLRANGYKVEPDNRKI